MYMTIRCNLCKAEYVGKTANARHDWSFAHLRDNHKEVLIERQRLNRLAVEANNIAQKYSDSLLSLEVIK